MPLVEKQAAQLLASLEEGAVQFLTSHAHEVDLFTKPDGRTFVRCSVTQHEMVPELPVLEAHWSGKRYSRMASNASNADPSKRKSEQQEASVQPEGKKRKKASAEGNGSFVPPRCKVDEKLGPHHLHQTASKEHKGGGMHGGDSDEWQTCKESWASIAPLLGHFKKKRVWMPFYYDGVCASHLRQVIHCVQGALILTVVGLVQVGFKDVYHKKRDFFALAKDKAFLSQIDVVIDNPPYTGEQMKTDVLKTLKEIDKPFVMLLPLTVLHSKLLRDVLDTKHVQAIIPRRVMVRKSEAESEANAEDIPFKYLVWLCYRMNIKGGLQFV